MAKYLVETYYNCSFKISHYLDDVNEAELDNLEKREDGKLEVIDVKLENRKTKSLDKNSKKSEEKKVDFISESSSLITPKGEEFYKLLKLNFEEGKPSYSIREKPGETPVLNIFYKDLN